MEGDKKKYTHIFDCFDADGKWCGGYELCTDSTEKPKINGLGRCMTAAYMVYLGWCEDEKTCAFCGCCYSDNVKRNAETKELTNVTRKVTCGNGDTVDMPVTSVYSNRRPTYEEDCKFVGMEPSKAYVEYKANEENKFKAEHEKVKNDAEYFRKTYYELRNRHFGNNGFGTVK